MDEAALGWQVDGLFLFPERLLSLTPPATAGLFPCASLTKLWVCFFVAGKSVVAMKLPASYPPLMAELVQVVWELFVFI